MSYTDIYMQSPLFYKIAYYQRITLLDLCHVQGDYLYSKNKDAFGFWAGFRVYFYIKFWLTKIAFEPDKIPSIDPEGCVQNNTWLSIISPELRDVMLNQISWVMLEENLLYINKKADDEPASFTDESFIKFSHKFFQATFPGSYQIGELFDMSSQIFFLNLLYMKIADIFLNTVTRPGVFSNGSIMEKRSFKGFPALRVHEVFKVHANLAYEVISKAFNKIQNSQGQTNLETGREYIKFFLYRLKDYYLMYAPTYRSSYFLKSTPPSYDDISVWEHILEPLPEYTV